MFEVGYLSDKGRVRKNNEDSFYVGKEIGLFVVADGIGGHNAGEVASRMAVEHIRTYIEGALLSVDDLKSLLNEAIINTNKVIYERSLEDDSLSGMGTTIAVTLVRDGELYVAHVGDSRAYMLSENGELMRLTEDHTVVSGWISRGMITKEDARRYPMGHKLTRAVGVKDEVEVDIEVFPYTNELVLLCSDGLTDMVEDEEISAVLAKTSDPQEACDRLVDLANQRGGRDDITVVVFKMR